MGGISNYIKDKIPDFTLENGVLNSEYPITYESSSIHFYLDTSVEKYEEKDIDKSNAVQILVSKSNAIMYSGGLVSNYQFKDLAMLKYSKKQLLKDVWLIYVVILFYVVIAYISEAFNIIVTVLLFAFVGLFSNNMYQFTLSFGQLVSLGIYATAIVTVLESVNSALGLISATAVSVVGMIWSAFYYFNSLMICGQKKRQGEL